MPGKLLLVNACVRRERSRTLRLARALIKRYPDYTVDEMVLEDMHLRLDPVATPERTFTPTPTP